MNHENHLNCSSVDQRNPSGVLSSAHPSEPSEGRSVRNWN
ncbi:hypothetical protein AM1_A0377 (plasmid) [Acaryochloris marina MBIC11017]|uniref:Uncharacterized protein n=1 Tax=Acaryochloris marina (strain MBIC 11017) TaxID=329726 RepID=A8ZL27_ACAM1|nr:hypothetical protein AM1_A0377 [Acaryochloris marina MBIC11017]